MARVEIEMPQMGESVMEGTVIEWSKNVGDMVEEDETLLEIATDKVDTEVPSPEAGKLVERLAEEGDVIEVGQAIAVIETEADGDDSGDDAPGDEPADEAQDTNEAAEQQEADSGDEEDAREEQEQEDEEPEQETQKPAASGDGGERVEVKMPQMGESVMEGTVIGWMKDIGDSVEEDETLLEISTDKVDSEVPSPQAGTLLERLAEEGDVIEVGQAIAIIGVGEGAQAAAAGDSSDDAGDADEQQTQQQSSEESQDADQSGDGDSQEQAADSDGDQPQRMGSDGRFYSPLVRSIAKEEGISQQELEQIEGSGQGGRVSKQDILDYVEKGGASKKAASADKQQQSAKKQSSSSGLSKPAASGQKQSSGGGISAGQLDVKRPSDDVEVVKMDRMRKMIAEHMINSKKTSAHVTTFAEVDVTKMVRWRQKNKADFKDRSGYKLTFTPLFIEQIIQAMREYPLINSSIDLEKGEIHLKKNINFGLAVALGDSGDGGLIVPVIKKAQEKNLVGLAGEVSELAQKARSKDLSPDDLVGGTITLTNYGSVGNLMGTPIINQPQVAIIGTGAIEKRPVVVEADGQDVIAIRHMMYLSMSYDHRIIDGAHGGAFLNRIKELLEDFDPERDA